jgi:hypothetical protein
LVRLTATGEVMMDLEKRFALIMRLVESQERAVFSVHGVIYDGFVLRCLNGRMDVVARPYGTDDVRENLAWDLGEVDTFGLFENDVDDEVEDPLMGTARDLAGQAKRWDELSLAERLVHQHTPRGATS